jgi:hypothetical protein
MKGHSARYPRSLHRRLRLWPKLPLKEGLWETSMMASQNITSHDMTNRGFERQSTPREEL